MLLDKNAGVSVIIPVYNDAAGAERCLDALLKQSLPFAEFQVILVDNHSSPPLKVTEKYPFDLQVVVCRKAGAYAARNVGAQYAGGDILAFTDADCRPAREWLKTGRDMLVKEHGESAGGGEVLLESPEQKTAVALYQLAIGFEQQANIESKKFSATANLFCTSEQFARVGGFDEALLSGGDRLWCWKARALGYRLTFLPGAIVYTKPRTSLRKAMIQARRVAGGRYVLRQLFLQSDHVTEKHIIPHRNIRQSLKWIARHPDFSCWQRLQIFWAASLIKATQLSETLLLFLGKKPERR